jgi:hypothetical protein
MVINNYLSRGVNVLPTIVVIAVLVSLSLMPLSTACARAASEPDNSKLKIQALVMSMADDYIASVSESVSFLTHSGKLDSKGRWLAQSFLRNAVGASLDIAVGSNPSVSILDLLVLTSLQSWSFETHWIPSGIGDTGNLGLDHLKQAEVHAWTTAKAILTEEQLVTLREVIDAWISENPDRTVVALVRFDEFADERKISSLSLRGKARGLLSEVSEAGAAVEDVRLLGERLLWLAGRYLYLLGEQTELTAYRLIDQPEGAQIMAAINSTEQLSKALTERIGTFQGDLEDQQAAFFLRISTERTAAISQLENALEAVVEKTFDSTAESINYQRTEAIDQLFDRLAQERKMFLDDIASRQNELLGVMTELNETITVSGTLAKELTGTVNAIDNVVSRFDADPDKRREPLRMTDVRDAAIEAGRTAEQVTLLLERVINLSESNSLDQRISFVTDFSEDLINQAFWRGVILILLLIIGLGLIRLVPLRNTDSRNVKLNE